MNDTLNPNLDQYRTSATSAANDASSLQADVPGLLSSLKQNLTSIFSKDNPMIQARDTALQDYLNEPSKTRASLLPSNLPTVAGSNLNLSPTQQQAIVTARNNAAFVPLMGLNQSIVSQYGNIGDIIQGAAATYAAQQQAAQQKAANALDMYKAAMAEVQGNKPAAGSGSSGLGSDISSILSSILGNQTNNRPDISSFDESDNFLYGGGNDSAYNAPAQQPLSFSNVGERGVGAVDNVLKYLSGLWGGVQNAVNAPPSNSQSMAMTRYH